MNGYELTSSRIIHHGRVITLHTDQVRMPDGEVAERDVVEHPGAVVIVALDDAGRVLLVTQYRHPVRGNLVELPAGSSTKRGKTPMPPPAASCSKRPICAPTPGIRCSICVSRPAA